jgi:hypothetical protein
MKTNILFAVLLTSALAVSAQKQILSIGSTASLTIKAGTVFSEDSLVLTPGADFTLTSNTIEESAASANVTPATGINRVYTLANQVTFTGTLQIYYQPSDLNGDAENTLQYTDSATSVGWLAEPSSTVNTTSHFVQFVATGKSFAGATASGTPIILALSLISFTGSWNQPTPALQWIVDQTGEAVSFDVFSSSDGVNWNAIGEVNGQTENSINTYAFTDTHPPALIMYYRIKLSQMSGQSTWSNTIELKKAGNNNNVRLLVNNNAVSIIFSGAQPTSIRLINASGQVLRTNMTSQPEYDFSGLVPGAYFLQYELNGQWTVREFAVF